MAQTIIVQCECGYKNKVTRETPGAAEREARQIAMAHRKQSDCESSIDYIVSDS